MRFFDEKFRRNKGRYVLQACFAGAAVGVALVLFDVVKQPVIIASFGASAFIAFTMPHGHMASPRHLIGGYIVGVIVGCLVHFVTLLPIDQYITAKGLYIISGAFAVMLSVFIMTVTDTEHPPASSIALGFVINEWDIRTVVLILVGISVISFIQRALSSRMIDILESPEHHYKK